LATSPPAAGQASTRPRCTQTPAATSSTGSGSTAAAAAPATKANSIGGERGNTIRDAEPLQAQIKRYRELQSKAQKSCFLDPDAK
jgi:hypothetical protein